MILIEFVGQPRVEIRKIHVHAYRYQGLPLAVRRIPLHEPPNGLIATLSWT
jgi:hypothetical protein